MSAGLATDVLALLVRQGATVAVAESLTGGLIGATLTVPSGASAAFRGGVIVYSTDLKARLLGVPRELLERVGAVHPDVAAAMAAGVRRVTESSFGLAVTGVAGPDEQDGRPVGTVHVAVAGAHGNVWHRDVLLRGSREDIRERTVKEGLDLLRGVLEVLVGEQSG
ncbi:CinA family protein [Sphaerisporangium dianthi]|uniref:CinA family protein n=1 Tax=Sphaerisporangium dianthi TaxID=1436120 RepID=A0ABV9C9P6_9ACTN